MLRPAEYFVAPSDAPLKQHFFLAKFNEAGKAVWSQSWGNGLGYTQGTDVVIEEATGNMLIGGMVRGEVDVSQGQKLGVPAKCSSFVAKLAGDGALLWTKGMEAGCLSTWAGDLAVNANGVTAALMFSKTLDVGDTPKSMVLDYGEGSHMVLVSQTP